MPLREHYEEEKSRLTGYVLRMCEDTIGQLHNAVKAAETGDQELYRVVRDQRLALRTLETAIDDISTHVIALESPVAGDLRLIISFIKIGSNFERINRHAQYLSRLAQLVDRKFYLPFLPKINAMAETAISMLSITLHAIAGGEISLLEELKELDDKVDGVFHALYAELTTSLRSDSVHMDDGVKLLLLLRYMERVGDHVTNIAEWVHFARTGEHVEFNH